MVLMNTTNDTNPEPPTTDRLKAGYQYRDVVVFPQDNHSDKFDLNAPWAPNLTVKFSLRDMKYLSNANNSYQTTYDPLVMAGQKELSMTLNFNDLTE